MKAGLRKGPDRVGGDGKKAATMRAELASMTRLCELSTRLTATTDLPSILYEMLDAVIELQSADFGDVQLYDEATGTLKIVAHRGLDQGFLDYFAIVDAKETSACGMALRAGARIIIEDVNSDPAFEPHRGIAASTGFRSIQSTPLFDQNSGKPVGMLSTHFHKPHRPSDHELRLTDIYARQAADVITYQLAEQRLRESEDHLRLALDGGDIGTWEWDSKTNLFVADARQRSFFGLPPHEGPLPAEIYWRQMVPEEIDRGLEMVHSALEEGGAFQNEQRVIRSDGQIVWLLSRGKAKHSDPSRVVGVSFDITERKRTESRLERSVEARTRELETVNRQLRAQIEQRETAEAVVQQLQRLEAIGRITAGVAHDFNNLLSVVLMNARLLLRKPRDELETEGLELISAAAERGAKLTTQLLAFARKQRLEPRPVDLNNMILGLDDLLGVTLGGTLQLNKTFAPDLRLAMVDPNQIELTVLNLALNARDAMQPGGTLTLETSNAVVEKEPTRPEEPTPGEYVVLAVKDTGTGIPDNLLPRVFEPFFTTKEPGKGSGLGLSQVVGFAKQSGGGVSIETRVGDGTSVKVFLPHAPGVLGDGEREAAVAEEGPRATTLRVLVVDDDQAVLNSTLRMLDFLGYAAVSARSGDEALNLVRGELDIDIVLADYAMPKMSGVELTKALQLLKPALPVVLVTGYVDLDVLKKLDRAQILQKPYSEGDLAEKIMAAVGWVRTPK